MSIRAIFSRREPRVFQQVHSSRGYEQSFPCCLMAREMDDERLVIGAYKAVNPPPRKIVARHGLAAIQVIGHVRLDERKTHLEQGNIDKLAPAGFLPRKQSRHDTMRSEDAGGVICYGKTSDLGIIEIGDQAQHAAESLTDRIKAGLVTIRPALPIPGNRTMDQFRIEL